MLRKLITFRGPYKILNLAWMAFFLTRSLWSPDYLFGEILDPLGPMLCYQLWPRVRRS